MQHHRPVMDGKELTCPDVELGSPHGYRGHPSRGDGALAPVVIQLADELFRVRIAQDRVRGVGVQRLGVQHVEHGLWRPGQLDVNLIRLHDPDVSQPPVQDVSAANVGPASWPTITPAVQPIFTPPEPESASTTIPTIPSLLNPAAGLSSLWDPTMFQAEFAQFSSLVSILNGGQPVNIASLFNTSPGLTGLPSLLNPMAVLTQIVKAAAQNLPNATQNVAASMPSATRPPAQTIVGSDMSRDDLERFAADG